MAQTTDSEKKFLEYGYKAGILLAFVSIITAAVYIFLFRAGTPDPKFIENELHLLSVTAEGKLLLLSVAMFIAMAFGFLGFSLFLIQAKGEVDAEGSVKDYKFKFARLSPGLFVILCSTVIIIFSATHKIEYGLGRKSTANEGDTTTSHGNGVDTAAYASSDELGIDTSLASKNASDTGRSQQADSTDHKRKNNH